MIIDGRSRVQRGRLVAMASLAALVALLAGGIWLAVAPPGQDGARLPAGLDKLAPLPPSPEISDNPVELIFGTETPDWNLGDFDVAGTVNDPSVYIEADAAEAQAINKRLPMSRNPLVPAPPFFLRPDTPLDRSRAQHCLALAIYYEAKSEPLTGQQAVAQVVLNRVRHPAWPHSVCGVVFQGSERSTGCQFSFTCDGSMARRPTGRPWQIAQSLAYSALSGQVAPEVGLATHYHADYVAPRWAPSLEKLAQIGVHIFYTWRGRGGLIGAFRTGHDGKEAWPAKASASAPELGPAEAATAVSAGAVAAGAAASGVAGITTGPGLPGSATSPGGAAGVLNGPQFDPMRGEVGLAGRTDNRTAQTGQQQRTPRSGSETSRPQQPSIYADGMPPEPDLESLVPKIQVPSSPSGPVRDTAAAATPPPPMVRERERSRALDGL